ncbi:MAG: polysaccharide pyruvyl transferase family protein [Oscillospiraceae bacterium]|nr:polysaccharide pyruvyl transferase family protein [Oscillospiraceae bacterium]
MKYLIRTGMLPYDNFSISKVLQYDLTWSNIGNMLFPASVIKSLMLDESVEFVPLRGQLKDIAQKHEATCEANIFPFANAFREGTDSSQYIALVKNSSKPSIIIGIGFQGTLNESLNKKFPFDADAKDLVSSVLEKSVSIGVRGKTTKQYLCDNLGFPEDRVDVIGCPSLFLPGPNFSGIRSTENVESFALTLDTKISKTGLKFFESISRLYKIGFFAQSTPESRQIYAPSPISHVRDYHEVFPTENMVSFVNIPSWLSFLREYNFAFSNKVHGTIAALLAGTPAVCLADDSRLLELCQHHKIPYVLPDEINDLTLSSLIAKADYTEFYSVYKSNFENYVKFMNKNGLKTIWDNGGTGEGCAYDKKMSSIKFEGPVTSIYQQEPREIVARLHDLMKQREKNATNIGSKNRSLKIARLMLDADEPADKVKAYTEISDEGLKKLLDI